MTKNALLANLGKLCALALIFSCTVSVTAVTAQETAATAQETAPSATHKPILGGISHDVRLPGLPDEYHAGSPFDQTNLQALTPDNVWMPIPDWYAGKWHSEFKTVEYGEDLKTGLTNSTPLTVKEAADTVHGHQRDKSGQIWEFLRIPRSQKAECSEGTAYLRALREDILENDPSHIVLKILNNQMTIDHEKQKIISSNQVQQIGTYTPVEDGLIKLEASLKNFDDAGNPLLLVRSSKLMKRVSPYEDINDLDGQNLKRLFAEYLRKIGKQDLVP
jgi:hypothetical protein